MNTSAFEFVVTQRPPHEGVVIYSEFAGSAAFVREGALLTNPYDNEDMASTLLAALTMPRPERHLRHKKLLRWMTHGALRADVWTSLLLRDFKHVCPAPRRAARHVNGVHRACSCRSFLLLCLWQLILSGRSVTHRVAPSSGRGNVVQLPLPAPTWQKSGGCLVPSQPSAVVCAGL